MHYYLDIETEGIDKDGNNKKYKLADFKNGYTIIYFYPKDDTPVCTQEAYEFKEAMDKLNKYAAVIGVSSDSIEEHKEFKEKHKLNFIILSDKFNKLKKAFAEQIKPASELHRTTIILDKDGNIIKCWEKVDIDGHIKEILDFFETK